MAVSDFFTALGAGELFSGGFTLLELVLAAVLTFLFAGTLALSVLAARSAGAARQAREEAREALVAVSGQAADFRVLAADLERMAGDLAASQAELREMQAAAPAPRQDYAAEGSAAPLQAPEAPEAAAEDAAPVRAEMAEAPDDEETGRGGKAGVFRKLLRRR